MTGAYPQGAKGVHYVLPQRTRAYCESSHPNASHLALLVRVYLTPSHELGTSGGFRFSRQARRALARVSNLWTSLVMKAQ